MKKGININNYESYVIDFLDGTLTPEDVKMFMEFLSDNPQIAADIDGLNEARINPDTIVFEKKHELEKASVNPYGSINELNYDEYFIGYHDGDLNEKEANNVLNFIDINKKLKDEFLLHGKLKIQPDEKVIYPHKEDLKKRNIIPIIRFTSVAATIILLLGWAYSIFFVSSFERSHVYISKVRTIEGKLDVRSEVMYIDLVLNEDMALPDIPEEQISQREIIDLAVVDSRSINEELVNVYDFARITSNNLYVYDQQIVSADNNLQDNKNDKRSLLASVISNQWNKISNRFVRSNNRSTSKDDPTYVQVLEKSIIVFNTITGSETATSKTYSSDGQLTSYQVEGRELVLNRVRGRSVQ